MPQKSSKHLSKKNLATKKDGSQGEQPAINEEIAVLQLTGDSFEHRIEHGVTFVTTWVALAGQFAGNPNAKIDKVDCTLPENKQICNEQGVDGFPRVFLYKKSAKFEKYVANKRGAPFTLNYV